MSNKEKESQTTAPEQEPQEEVKQETAAEETVEQEEPPKQEETAAPDPVESLKKDLAAREDQLLRLAAEYDNFRRRSVREKSEAYSKAKADAAEKFLPVYDNLERALNQGTEDQAFLKGVEMTMNQLVKALESLDIHKIDALGKPFDPNFHNAVMHTEDENLGENVVAQVFQTGFIMGDRVIRHAMVQVAN
ncbi:MAG: nucleotide exchange factor GrpE [Clostridiales bacterium]|nr:nucleotide exchange factor GrpE [Clostridiales bacterium]